MTGRDITVMHVDWFSRVTWFYNALLAKLCALQLVVLIRASSGLFIAQNTTITLQVK